MTGPRNPLIDRQLGGQTWSDCYDPDGSHHSGLPTYPYRLAPAGYATVRQLRASGLRPGGQEPCAQILWRRGHRLAYLYQVTLALPKRTATPAQQEAIDKALRARRTCPTCGDEKGYYIPRTLGECLDCDEIRHMCMCCYTRQDYPLGMTADNTCHACRANPDTARRAA